MEAIYLVVQLLLFKVAEDDQQVIELILNTLTCLLLLLNKLFQLKISCQSAYYHLGVRKLGRTYLCSFIFGLGKVTG